MAMHFIKVEVAFRRHGKIDLIGLKYKDNPIDERPNDIRVAIENLWAYCMENKQDGSLGSSIRMIAINAQWKGRPDELIKILTNPEHTFIDVDDEGKYYLHNWYKHNSKLQPERQETITSDKTRAANVRHTIGFVKVLTKRGIPVKDCKWLNMDTQQGGCEILSVDINKLPKHVQINGKYYKDKTWFWEDWKNKYADDKKKRAELLKLIKKHTKRCKCSKLFISQEYDTCYDCQGER